jgi:excisionase family DNA binding protein
MATDQSSSPPPTVPTVCAPLSDYLTINQTCHWLSVSRRTLYNWMHSGKVAYVRTPGGGRRILRSTLIRSTDAESVAVAVAE